METGAVRLLHSTPQVDHCGEENYIYTRAAEGERISKTQSDGRRALKPGALQREELPVKLNGPAKITYLRSSITVQFLGKSCPLCFLGPDNSSKTNTHTHTHTRKNDTRAYATVNKITQ